MNIYDFINPLPYKMEYWTDNKENIVALMKQKNPQIVIEVGAWLGFTSIEIAKNLSEGGHLIVVDPWEPFNDGISGVGQDPKMDTAYHQFLSNLIHNNVQHKVTVLKNKSLKASKMLKIKADIIFIDGAHDEESVYQDITAWMPLVSPNGVLCGDDWFLPGVRAAVERFSRENDYKIYLAPAKNQGKDSLLGDSSKQTFWWIEQ